MLSAQENLGATLSNYSPTSGILLNPSSSADSKAFIDLNLVGLGLFVNNNYAYVNGSARTLNSQNQSGQTITENYNTTNAPYKVKLDYLVHGPSLSFSYGKLGLGIYTGSRTYLSLAGVTNHLANHIGNGFNFADQLAEEFTTSNLRLGALSWLEYGVNGSYVIKQEGRDMFTVGATVKLLNGITGGGIQIQKWNYQVENDSILNSIELNGNYGLHDIQNSESPIGNGRGLGLDIGFNYKAMKGGVNNYAPHTTSGCRLVDYDYKFSAALLDIGRIGFNDGITRSFSVPDSIVWEDYTAADAQTINGVNELIANELLTDSATSTVFFQDENRLRMLLPTAFSAQFDYNIGYGFYANASLVHGFNRKKRLGVERPNTLAITPRYESKPVDVALPIVIRDYESIRLGLAFRVYYLTLGSDNIFSLLGGANRDTYGTDFYFNLKYTMFRPWYCSEAKSKSRPRRNRGGKKGQPCPSW